MNRKRESGRSFIFITVVLIVSILIMVMNFRMIFNVTSKQTEDLGTLQMNDIRAELQKTLDNAKMDTLEVSHGVEMILTEEDSLNQLEKYLRGKKSDLNDSSCINVYAAGSDWHVIPDFEAPEGFAVTEREWYIGALQKNGEVYISQPYMDLASDFVCFTVSRVINDDVVVSLDYNLLEVQQYISEMSEGGRTALIVTEDGKIAGYSEANELGKDIAEALPDYVDILNLEKNNTNQVVLPQVIDGVEQTVFCSKTENNWYLILCVNSAELYSSSYTQFALLCAVNAILIIAVVSLYLFTRKNRQKAEKELSAREEFLSQMSSELKTPIASIINNSNPDYAVSSKEGMERIRESALHMSEIVNNLQSYSSMLNQNEENNPLESEKDLTVGNKRTRFAITAVILLAMLVSVSLFTVSSMRLGNQQIQEEAETYEHELSQWITEQKSVLSMFCNMISADPTILDNYDECIRFLDDITRNYKDISVVYMTNPEAEHTVIMNNGWQPDEGWYVEERQWYIDTINSKDGFNISSPYFDSQTGLYCVTFSQRVYDADGQFLGNFGIDFYMDKLISILGESYTDSGYAFLVDADGSIINHPYAYYQMTQVSSNNVLDKNYKNAYAKEGTIDVFKDYDNVRKSCIASKNQDSQFTVIVVKNWWSVYGSIMAIDAFFIAMFSACVYAVYTMISRLMKWQESVNAQLQEAVDTATAAGKAKSQFLAQMSHEIRTPINAVLGMNEMIMRESNEEDIREYSHDIQSAGETLLSLINSILDFSKIEDGKMEIIDVEYDTSSMINDLVNMISERAKKKGLELKLDINPNLPTTLFGDDIRVRQVIINLLTNAVKYTNTGSVTLKMSGSHTADGRFNLAVSVSDTGIGIREEDKDKLCQSFQRLDQERNHNIEGTGLGLSIVNRLLQMMGSELKIDSVYGQGSDFYFNLMQDIVSDMPIGDYSKRRETAETSLNDEAYLFAPEAVVLVVDDNAMNLKVASSLMKRNGIVPDTASSGMECISMVENKVYDMIFLDHMMPGMDGVETLHRLVSQDLLPEKTAVIALTANAIAGAREKYLSEGFNDYLSKPIDVARLEQKLSKYLPESKISYKNKNGAISAETTDETEAEEHLINLEVGLGYCADDKEIYREVAQAYLDEADEKLEKLDNFYEQRDWKNYAIIAHALKSTSLTIGAESLSALAKEHEFAGKEERGDDIDATYFDLLQLYQSVLNELKALLETLE